MRSALQNWSDDISFKNLPLKKWISNCIEKCYLHLDTSLKRTLVILTLREGMLKWDSLSMPEIVSPTFSWICIQFPLPVLKGQGHKRYCTQGKMIEELSGLHKSRGPMSPFIWWGASFSVQQAFHSSWFSQCVCWNFSTSVHPMGASVHPWALHYTLWELHYTLCALHYTLWVLQRPFKLPLPCNVGWQV